MMYLNMMYLNILLLVLLPFGHSVPLSNSTAECSSEQDEIWNITWPTTMAGENATVKCPGGNETIGHATRECGNNNSWETPNVSQCRTIELIRLQAQARNLSNTLQQNDQKSMAMKNDTVENLEMLLSITADTNNVINSTYPILPSDIRSVVDILRSVLNVAKRGRKTFHMDPRSTEVAQNCVMILNTMLNERHDDSFETITKVCDFDTNSMS